MAWVEPAEHSLRQAWDVRSCQTLYQEGNSRISTATVSSQLSRHQGRQADNLLLRMRYLPDGGLRGLQIFGRGLAVAYGTQAIVESRDVFARWVAVGVDEVTCTCTAGFERPDASMPLFMGRKAPNTFILSKSRAQDKAAIKDVAYVAGVIFTHMEKLGMLGMSNVGLEPAKIVLTSSPPSNPAIAHSSTSRLWPQFSDPRQSRLQVQGSMTTVLDVTGGFVGPELVLHDTMHPKSDVYVAAKTLLAAGAGATSEALHTMNKARNPNATLAGSFSEQAGRWLNNRGNPDVQADCIQRIRKQGKRGKFAARALLNYAASDDMVTFSMQLNKDWEMAAYLISYAEQLDVELEGCKRLSSRELWNVPTLDALERPLVLLLLMTHFCMGMLALVLINVIMYVALYGKDQSMLAAITTQKAGVRGEVVLTNLGLWDRQDTAIKAAVTRLTAGVRWVGERLLAGQLKSNAPFRRFWVHLVHAAVIGKQQRTDEDWQKIINSVKALAAPLVAGMPGPQQLLDNLGNFIQIVSGELGMICFSAGHWFALPTEPLALAMALELEPSDRATGADIARKIQEAHHLAELQPWIASVESLQAKSGQLIPVKKLLDDCQPGLYDVLWMKGRELQNKHIMHRPFLLTLKYAAHYLSEALEHSGERRWATLAWTHENNAELAQVAGVLGQLSDSVPAATEGAVFQASFSDEPEEATFSYGFQGVEYAPGEEVVRTFEMHPGSGISGALAMGSVEAESVVRLECEVKAESFKWSQLFNTVIACKKAQVLDAPQTAQQMRTSSRGLPKASRLRAFTRWLAQGEKAAKDHSAEPDYVRSSDEADIRVACRAAAAEVAPLLSAAVISPEDIIMLSGSFERLGGFTDAGQRHHQHGKYEEQIAKRQHLYAASGQPVEPPPAPPTVGEVFQCIAQDIKSAPTAAALARPPAHIREHKLRGALSRLQHQTDNLKRKVKKWLGISPRPVWLRDISDLSRLDPELAAADPGGPVMAGGSGHLTRDAADQDDDMDVSD